MPKLDWSGKKAVVNHHRAVPFHLPKNNDELSVGDPAASIKETRRLFFIA
jgi:site-specific DNA-methyltransferase (adenine-specific)/adenine-specific DNA-methyltransferase